MTGLFTQTILLLCTVTLIHRAYALEEQKEVLLKIDDREPNAGLRGVPPKLNMFLDVWDEVEAKKTFVKLTNYDFGCTNPTSTASFDNYTFHQFGSCLWRDARDLPGVVGYTGFNENEAIPIIMEMEFPFFGKTIEAPSILMVSANGIVTVGFQNDADRNNPNLDTTADPVNVITAIWSNLTASATSTVYVGKFRMGLTVVCTVLQWTGFQTNTSDLEVEFQLDICSNGEFIVRILQATDLDESDIGVKNISGYAEHIGPYALGQSFTPNSAIVISPNNL